MLHNSAHSGPSIGDFSRRHIGLSENATAEMLQELGYETIEDFISQVIPSQIRTPATNAQPAHSEQQALTRLRQIADQNQVFRSYIGSGYYGCHTPTVILRNVLQNPAWYTAYTPYQPEISQGRLEALVVYQMMVSDLTGFEIANASLLDEATAAAEAMSLCYRVSKTESSTFFVSRDVHAQTLAVLQTRAESIGIELVVGNHETDLAGLECFGALFQYPGSSGEIHDFRDAIDALHRQGALAVMAVDLLSLTLLTPPAELGADIAIGSSQRFGVPLFCGGPHAAFFATKPEYKRSIPGRLIGLSVDCHDQPAYRMALQTREQHIRRERATSNICTAQALLAIAAAFYAVYHGPQGLREIANRVHGLTTLLVRELNRLGFAVANSQWFDTLTIDTGDRTTAIHEAAKSQRINLRFISDSQIGVSLDETVSHEDLLAILNCFALGSQPIEPLAEGELADLSPIPTDLQRDSEYLQHSVFHSYHTETEMLRYLRRLADKDLALDRTMIPLGSCTMKLNSTTEMIPVTWPEFADIHPHAPAEQTQGYAELIKELEQMLCRATGYDKISLQPNAGSQGEYAGLLAIKAYHDSRGQSQRNVCLIPESAHGTNPASAIMAGMKIKPLACDAAGNIDLQDLQAKVEQHSNDLAALMITYPSTHGVFEDHITQVCAIVHEHGGQVYIDGANLNAQVGLCNPGEYGGDVSHLNLHKTFCIPHGGGGPGVGPVAVKQHLAEFLPGNPLNSNNQHSAVGPVSAAPWGSAGILPISWAYIYMMGDAGLRQATEAAILSANYVAQRLAPHYPILYTGANGHVAHECIVDLRPLKETSGIEASDIAKRLIDYGFHAPTMSFPVPGTFMVEPTESESKQELDRFCAAMIQIREEIQAVEDGLWSREDNPLVNAPHTSVSLICDEWNHCYSPRTAAFPMRGQEQHKYWVPVGRINQAHGDRNLICTCHTPELAELEEVPG